MAIIGSIRKRGTLIVVIVGLSLAAFILGGAQNLFVGGSNTIASFNGAKLTYEDYSMKIEEKKLEVKVTQPDVEINEQAEDAIKDEVWEDLIRTKVYEKQYKLLGLTISDAEDNDMMVGETVDPNIRSIQLFMNEFGQFDPSRLQAYVQKFEDDSQVKEEEKQQWFTEREQWRLFTRKVKVERLKNKYMNLVTKAMYVTTKEATSVYKANMDHANIRFVVKLYSTIADSTIEVKEDELVSFFKEHKYRMRSKKSKAIKYAVFLSIPSPADTAALRKTMDELKAEMATTDDDTLFVAQNSEETTPPQFLKKGMLPPLLDSLLFNAPVGTVAGPFVESGYFMMGKKTAERMQPDSCKARHILIQPKENTQAAVDEARNLRDSIYKMIEKGGNFVQLAAQYSMDQSNAKDSGNLGWFAKGRMVPEFGDSCFMGKKGDMKKVDSRFGFHIVQILDQTKPIKESNIALVIKAIKPGDATKQIQYNLANDMAYPDKKVAGFDAAKHMENFAKQKNLIYRDEPSITESSKNILNMEGTKQVVKWALGAKRGDISDVFESGDNYIVAVVTATRPEGIPALEDVRDEAVAAFRRHKKAEKFISEFNSSLATSKDINGLAAASKLNVGSAQDLSFGSYFVPGAGIEPQLLGTVFGMKVNQLSKPIEGNSGVFVAVVDQFNPGAALPDYNFVKNDLMKNMANKASEALNAVKEKANVRDYRYKFDIF
jgi:peptidyl-prolyl cis-trans isomerase D